MLAFAFASVITRPWSDIASLGEFASGAPSDPFMTFHMSLLLVLVMAPASTSFQLFVFVSLIASLASLHAFIHFCLFMLMVRPDWFLVRILARTCGVIQSFAFFLGFVFPTCVSATEFRISVNRCHSLRQDWFVQQVIHLLVSDLSKFIPVNSVPSPFGFHLVGGI